MCFSDARIVMAGGKRDAACPDCIKLNASPLTRLRAGVSRVVREDRQKQAGYVPPSMDAPTRAST